MSRPANLLVAQSGGPTPVINASLYGITAAAVASGQVGRVLGAAHGVEGLLSDRLYDLTGQLPALAALKRCPGAALGGSRYPLSAAEVEPLLAALRRHEVRYLLYIGGNGSARTTLALHEAARQAGYDLVAIHVPKTIDNDLEGTDHTPGYGSAARFTATVAQNIDVDMRAMCTFDQVKILEAMGRNAGWVAAAAALARHAPDDGPHLIYVPEHPVDLATIAAQVRAAHREYGRVLMVVGEALRDPAGGLLLDRDACSDQHLRSGHPGGISHYLARVLARETGLKVRYDAPGTLFRSHMALVSPVDLAEAELAGRIAVRLALAGHSGHMVALDRIGGPGYGCAAVPVALAGRAGRERPLPAAFWDPERGAPTPAFRTWVAPLLGADLPPVCPRLHL